MDQKPIKRRWFRFSLATLFVLIAVVAIGLGVVTREVSQRKQLLKWVTENGGEVDRGDGAPQVVVVQVGDVNVVTDENQLFEMRKPTIPIWRNWFGDEAVVGIKLPKGSTKEEAEHAAVLFPEAYIVEPTERKWGFDGGFGTN